MFRATTSTQRLLLNKALRQSWNTNSKRTGVHTTLRKVRFRPGMVTSVQLEEKVINQQPNYYLNLQQKLDRINYYGNEVNEVNIGYAEDSECMAKFVSGSKEILSRMKIANDFDEDAVLGLNEGTDKDLMSDEEYRRLSTMESFTPEYLSSTKKLANHFAIFRDLFFVEPVRLETRREEIMKNARDLSKFDIKSQSPIFTFAPLVPIDAQFYVDSDSDSEYVRLLKSHRGNLIPPEFGLKPPVIVINSAAINGKSPIETSTERSPVVLSSGASTDPSFYTLALVNLDSHFNDIGVCHWMLANIHQDNNETTFDNVVKYLPVYGVRGLGYHRYAFVLFKHNKPLEKLNKIDDFDLGKRKFNGLEFMKNCTSQDPDLELVPVGLSWFQTTWDENCRKVFYDYLNMRSPTYEYIFPKPLNHSKQEQYPGRAPFNLYLDQFRDPKELSKEVLLERLKSIDILTSYNTDKMYQTWEGSPELPQIHRIPKGTPDWLRASIAKKNQRVGRFRDLRPASAILPHNNNADLDNPKWPRISPNVLPLNCPMSPPDGTRRRVALRKTLWSKPLNEHHSLRIDFVDSLGEQDRGNIK